MGTYNGGPYLREQLDSIAAQTHLPDELVVCDDDSTDRTVAILEDFAATAPFPVRVYVNPKNLGTAKNFERAIGLATGEVIALADQDDCGTRTSWSAWRRNSPGPSASGLFFRMPTLSTIGCARSATGFGRPCAPSNGTDGSSSAVARSRC